MWFLNDIEYIATVDLLCGDLGYQLILWLTGNAFVYLTCRDTNRFLSASWKKSKKVLFIVKRLWKRLFVSKSKINQWVIYLFTWCLKEEKQSESVLQTIVQRSGQGRTGGCSIDLYYDGTNWNPWLPNFYLATGIKVNSSTNFSRCNFLQSTFQCSSSFYSPSSSAKLLEHLLLVKTVCFFVLFPSNKSRNAIESIISEHFF